MDNLSEKKDAAMMTSATAKKNSNSKRTAATPASEVRKALCAENGGCWEPFFTESEERQVDSLTSFFNETLESEYGLDKEILFYSCTPRAMLTVVDAFKNVGWNVRLSKVQRDALSFWKIVIWF